MTRPASSMSCAGIFPQPCFLDPIWVPYEWSTVSDRVNNILLKVTRKNKLFKLWCSPKTHKIMCFDIWHRTTFLFLFLWYFWDSIETDDVCGDSHSCSEVPRHIHITPAQSHTLIIHTHTIHKQYHDIVCKLHPSIPRFNVLRGVACGWLNLCFFYAGMFRTNQNGVRSAKRKTNWLRRCCLVTKLLKFDNSFACSFNFCPLLDVILYRLHSFWGILFVHCSE